jgi:hypothetical protein
MKRFAGLTRGVALVAGVALTVTALRAQPVFRGSAIFPPEEFAARRAAVLTKIGDGVAIVLGTTEPPGEVPFRQNSQFFYLAGVTEPRAALIIDGRTKQTTVFLLPANERRDTSMFGPALAPGRRHGARPGRRPGARASGVRRGGHEPHHRPAHHLDALRGRSAGQPVAGRPHADVDGQQAGSVGWPRLA